VQPARKIALIVILGLLGINIYGLFRTGSTDNASAPILHLIADSLMVGIDLLP